MEVAEQLQELEVEHGVNRLVQHQTQLILLFHYQIVFVLQPLQIIQGLAL